MIVSSKFLILTFIFSTFGTAAMSAGPNGYDIPLEATRPSPNKNTDLVFFANHAQPVAKSDEGIYVERIYSLAEGNECDVGNRCPFARLYISFSSADVYPTGDEKLYVSLPAYNWKFLRWTSAPATPEYFRAFSVEGEHVVLTNGKIVGKGKFEIGVNTSTAYIKQVK